MPHRSGGGTCSAVLLCLVLLLAAAPAQAQTAPADRAVLWFDTLDVRGDEVYEDAILHVNGSINVHKGARLELRNVAVVFHGTDLMTGIMTANPGEGEPGGALHLVSTPRGATTVRHADPANADYLFVSGGALRIQGLPEAPVVVQHVRGKTSGSGIGLSATHFTDGFQIIGGPNHIDHFVMSNAGAGLGISSWGPTRISNTTITYVGVAMYLHFPADLVLRDVQLAAARTALFANGAANVSIHSSKLWGLDYGLIASNSEMQFVDTHFMGRADAAAVHNGGRHEFVGNRFSGYTEAGLAVFEHTDDIYGAPVATVVDNLFEGEGKARTGLLVESSEHVIATGNHFEDHVAHGMEAVFTGLVDLQGNTAERNGGLGFQITSTLFRESGNRFGSEETQNGDGAFVGSTVTSFRVVDRDGAPIPGASVLVQGGPLAQPVRVKTSAAGVATVLLELLRIDNDGERTEHAYEVVVEKEGVGITHSSIVPYAHEGASVIIVLGETAGIFEGLASPAVLGGIILVAGLATVGGVATWRRLRSRD